MVCVEKGTDKGQGHTYTSRTSSGGINALKVSGWCVQAYYSGEEGDSIQERGFAPRGIRCLKSQAGPAEGGQRPWWWGVLRVEQAPEALGGGCWCGTATVVVTLLWGFELLST